MHSPLLFALLAAILPFALPSTGSSGDLESRSVKEVADDWLMNPGYRFSLKDSSPPPPSIKFRVHRKVAVLASSEDLMARTIRDCLTRELQKKYEAAVELQTVNAVVQKQEVRHSTDDKTNLVNIGQRLGAAAIFLASVEKTPEGRPAFSIKVLDVQTSTVLGWADFKATAVGHPVYARGFLCEPIPRWMESFFLHRKSRLR